MSTGRSERFLVLAVLVAVLAGAAAADANVGITNVEAPSFADTGEAVKISATVENTGDEEAHQMEVKVEGFGQVKEDNLWGVDAGETNTVTAYIDAPEDQTGTHDIQISAQARDRDGNVIGGEQRTISIDVGESGTVVQPDSGELRIKEVAMPAAAIAGDTVTIDVTVANTGSRDITGLHVATTAFGRTIDTDAGMLDGESTRTIPVTIDVPQAARGRENIEIEVSSHNGVATTSATLIIEQLHATLNLRETEVTVGDHVTVSGIMSQRNTRADLYVGGDFEAPVFSGPNGQYTHTIIPRKPGIQRVTLRAGGQEIEKLLTVNPEITVGTVSVPDRVATGTIFDVCSQVSRSSSGDTTIQLRVDGQLRETATVPVSGSRKHCFSTSVSSSGNHTVTVEASSGSVTASEERTVTAVDTGLSASVFPDRLTLTSGQAGVFQVRIENDRLSRRRFDVSIDGFQNLSLQSPGTVDLRRGGSTTAVVRVVPPASGRYTGTITVSHSGTTLADQRVTVLAVENPALKNPVVGGAARWAEQTAERFGGLSRVQKWVILGIGGLLVAGAVWVWRRRRRRVMEPKY